MERIRKFLDFLEEFVIVLFIFMLISTYIVRIFSISGNSMSSTLEDGDMVITSILPHDYQQGDIVVVNSHTSVTLNNDGSLNITNGANSRIVKRIIATGGQSIYIDFGAGAVFVDGERIFEKYLTYGLTHKDEDAFDYPVTVPNGYVFVMGDNRSVSLDSRSVEMGFVPESDIIGRIVLRLSPFDKFGTLE